MSQIVKRKKGRPSKADLARRVSSSPAEPNYDLRRSHRRRSVTYNFDFDDYLDQDEEEEEEEEERRREKKLKLVLKLNQGDSDSPARGRGRPASRGRHAAEDAYEREEEEEKEGEDAAEEEEEEEDDDDSEKKPLKRMKINGDGEEERDYDQDGGRGDDGDVDEERARNGGANLPDSAQGTPCDPPSCTPMPDKKSLDLILDKLQKKDIYGVYAEPVDPEELPDYHDIIEQPMDFATVRKKLANGSYPTLEYFESDVFLICSNAMQYNSPDTVYYKQARTIQEMAKKKFEKIRVKIERAEKELKSEQKIKPNSTAKKQMKKPLSRTVQEAIGSDFSSGAELATGGAIQNGHIPIQTGRYEKSSGAEAPAEVNLFISDNSHEKTEELSTGKGQLHKLGKKLAAIDENRRATYDLTNQPVDRSESIFTTFEAEIKQLVAVGLHAELSYARSLARFAAMLGPIAWKVASQRVEQALPAEIKFGRGWVGEYEPLPTPVLILETQAREESSNKLQPVIDTRRDEMPSKTPMPVKEQPTSGIVSEGKTGLFHSSENKVSFVASCERKSSTPVYASSQQRDSLSQKNVVPRNNASQQVELNLPPSNNQNNAALVPDKQSLSRPETVACRSRDTVARNMNIARDASSKQLERNGVVPGGLPNGKVTSFSNSRMINVSSDNVMNQMAQAASRPFQQQEQGLSDPSRFMRVVSDQVQTAPPIRRDDSTNAAMAAARAWMSIGAGGGFRQPTENSSSPRNQISAESLYNPARDLHPQVPRVQGEIPLSSGMQFRPERNNYPFQAFVSQPVSVNGPPFQNRPPMVFPQFVTSDFSRFPVQSTWRGVSPHVAHIQLKQRQDNLPPDLNIGVQSPDSPAKQSSGVRVESQQPDLALQL